MEELKKHLQGGTSESAPVSRKAGFECPSCNYVEDSEGNMRKHMASNHQTEGGEGEGC